jgi:hypothetical protein
MHLVIGFFGVFSPISKKTHKKTHFFLFIPKAVDLVRFRKKTRKNVKNTLFIFRKKHTFGFVGLPPSKGQKIA